MYVTFDKCVFHFQLNLQLSVISLEERFDLKAIFHNCCEYAHLNLSDIRVKKVCNHAAMHLNSLPHCTRLKGQSGVQFGL